MIRVRVVCGLSEVIATLVPTMRLTSVDFPTLGRPDEGDEAGAHQRLVRRGGRRVEGVEAVDADAADAPADDPLGGELASPSTSTDSPSAGTWPSCGEEQAADRVPVALGQLGSQQVVHLVERPCAR